MDDEKVKIEFLYGSRLACERPDVRALIYIPPPPKWYELLYYGAIELLLSVVLPALLFAIAWTLLVR